MRITRSATLLSRQKERQEIVLMPEEILIRIWSFLDFDTLQKICVLVSKSWFDKIRNSYLAHVSEQPNFRIPNTQYLQQSFVYLIFCMIKKMCFTKKSIKK